MQQANLSDLKNLGYEAGLTIQTVIKDLSDEVIRLNEALRLKDNEIKDLKTLNKEILEAKKTSQQ